MITIDFLNGHQDQIPQLAYIWQEALGKIWMPDLSQEYIESLMGNWIGTDTLDLAYVALDQDTAVGIASLQKNAGIRPDLSPWLGSLVIDPQYQHHGIGTQLVEKTKQTAKNLGFKKLYLFTFDTALINYYARFGFQVLTTDQFYGNPVTVMMIIL